MLTTVFTTLAMTGLYPSCLPRAATLPCGSLGAKLLTAAIGIIGLGVVASLKVAVGKLVCATWLDPAICRVGVYVAQAKSAS